MRTLFALFIFMQSSPKIILIVLFLLLPNVLWFRGTLNFLCISVEGGVLLGGSIVFFCLLLNLSLLLSLFFCCAQLPFYNSRFMRHFSSLNSLVHSWLHQVHLLPEKSFTFVRLLSLYSFLVSISLFTNAFRFCLRLRLFAFVYAFFSRSRLRLFAFVYAFFSRSRFRLFAFAVFVSCDLFTWSYLIAYLI